MKTLMSIVMNSKTRLFLMAAMSMALIFGFGLPAKANHVIASEFGCVDWYEGQGCMTYSSCATYLALQTTTPF